jgi:hypothetical protein
MWHALYFDVDGWLYMTGANPAEKVLEAMAYQTAASDIFINSYPRSGTNLVAQLVSVLTSGGKFDIRDFERHTHAFRCAEFATIDQPDGRCLPLNSSHPPTSIIVSHMPAKHAPFRRDAGKHIVIIRNPFAQITSYFYDLQAFFGGKSLCVPWFVFMYFEVFQRKTGWAEWVAGWWARRDEPNVLIVRFEDVATDTEKEIIRIAKFLNIHDPPIAETLRKTSFQYMKDHEHHFKIPNHIIPKSLRKKEHSDIHESGPLRKLLFSPHQLQATINEFRRRLNALGSDFPLDDYLPDIDCDSDASADKPFLLGALYPA